MNNILLQVKDVVKSYKTGKHTKLDVLKSVSLEIEREKISVIIGASGAGKSTLLHIMGALDYPDSGQIWYDEKDISSLPDEKIARFRNERIGFVFQFHHLLPEFTALENVAIPQMIAGKSLSAAVPRAKELLDSVGLTDRTDHKPAELSGGEQQRVAVARALSNDPDIIFADEPTGNLDSNNSEEIHKIFLNLRDEFKKTFVIVTHNSALMNLADKVYEMKDGKLL